MKMNKNERISMGVFGTLVVILHIIFGIFSSDTLEMYVNYAFALFWIGAIVYCFI